MEGVNFSFFFLSSPLFALCSSSFFPPPSNSSRVSRIMDIENLLQMGRILTQLSTYTYLSLHICIPMSVYSNACICRVNTQRTVFMSSSSLQLCFISPSFCILNVFQSLLLRPREVVKRNSK